MIINEIHDSIEVQIIKCTKIVQYWACRPAFKHTIIKVLYKKGN